ncbi:hypothetical protein ACOJIV_17715 [Haloarcula sp. AONF1]
MNQERAKIVTVVLLLLPILPTAAIQAPPVVGGAVGVILAVAFARYYEES